MGTYAFRKMLEGHLPAVALIIFIATLITPEAYAWTDRSDQYGRVRYYTESAEYKNHSNEYYDYVDDYYDYVDEYYDTDCSCHGELYWQDHSVYDDMYGCVTNVDDPGVTNVDDPGVTNVDGPGVTNVDGPGVTNVDDPGVTNVDDPGVTNVDGPGVRSLAFRN